MGDKNLYKEMELKKIKEIKREKVDRIHKLEKKRQIGEIKAERH